INGIDHFSFSITWVYTFTFYRNYHLCSVEILVLEFANLGSVHRVCPLSPKLLNIKLMGSSSNFLIWGKSNSYSAMTNVRVVYQVFHCSDDFGHTSLVVCSQKCCSISSYYGLTFILF